MSKIADGLSNGLSFVVQNITSGRAIKIFNTLIYPGGTLDLMQVPGISEEDIRAALVKGDLRNKIVNKQFKVIVSPEIIASNFGNTLLDIVGVGTTIRPMPVVPGIVKTLTNNAATSLFQVDMSQTFNYPSTTPDLSFACKLFFSCECTDGNDVQVRSGDVNAMTAMKGATIATGQGQNTGLASTGGTLVANFSWLTSGTIATLQVTPVSSLTPTNITFHYFLLHATHRAPAYSHV